MEPGIRVAYREYDAMLEEIRSLRKENSMYKDSYELLEILKDLDIEKWEGWYIAMEAYHK